MQKDIWGPVWGLIHLLFTTKFEFQACKSSEKLKSFYRNPWLIDFTASGTSLFSVCSVPPGPGATEGDGYPHFQGLWWLLGSSGL